MFGLDPGTTAIFIFCILAACIFEFVNGFHDTANAVATVIYTNSMKPTTAVIWSGMMNFLGVYLGGIAVAMSIVKILPTILFDQSIAHSLSIILPLIFTAILWNIGTWYFGIPCSSSHTLIGSIFGVGLAYGFLPDTAAIALNWQKVKDVGLSLLISPVFGFGIAMGVIYLMKKNIRKKKFYAEFDKKKKPPFWIRLFLIATSTLLSITHGSNDGQKGVGLVMIILIALIPIHFALDNSKKPEKLLNNINNIEKVINKINTDNIAVKDKLCALLIREKIDTIKSSLLGAQHFNTLSKEINHEIRKDISIIVNEIPNLMVQTIGEKRVGLSKDDKNVLKENSKEITKFIEYTPWWVILMISLSLGLGTMIGWKRIAVTIGEKIGKENLTYAQASSANLVAASTIGLSTLFGLPVSTTHVLSSGVAGSMVATNGIGNLRMKTVKNILIAWLVTLPVTIVLSGGLFLLFRLFL